MGNAGLRAHDLNDRKNPWSIRGVQDTSVSRLGAFAAEPVTEGVTSGS